METREASTERKSLQAMVTPDFYRQVAEVAKSEGRTVSNWTRFQVEQALKQRERERKSDN
jgi:hypothetical protein